MSLEVNYSDVYSQMQAAGLRLEGELQLDTAKPVRCRVEGDRERRGWYALSTIELEGECGRATHIIGAYGIWRGNDNGKIPVRPDKTAKQTHEQRAAITERIAANNRRAKAARTAEAERAAQRAAKLWRVYQLEGASAYLQRKGVQAEGLRFHPEKDTIAVPMRDPKGKLWGVQLIRGADRGTKLEKQYWPKGLDKVGHYHLIGGSPRDLLLIAEGYATANSLLQAISAPVAVAFDAGNLLHVAKVLRRQYPRARILICADDDYATDGNPGIASATAAALAIDARWLAPSFTDAKQIEARRRIAAGEITPLPGAVGLREDEQRAAKAAVRSLLRDIGTEKATDWNDLHALEGLPAVRAQLETFLTGIGWAVDGAQPRRLSIQGGGDAAMVPRLSVDDAALRYWGTYGFGGKLLFDEVERRLVHKDDVVNLLPRHGWDALKEHPDWRVARDWEIGFDPAQTDPKIRCNLYAGWPTEPKEGRCDILLELLEYLCSGEPNSDELYQWVLDWLAYPIQYPGAKMHSALVVHGPQGTGKNLFFEAICKIYGDYGRLLGQEALEDKFNSDWAEKKLFILADEVLARQDMFHVKNRLKSFITGGTIRVNPKHTAAHNERNCMNIVFLSNERMPVVLENDDRRHCIIWSPPKLPPTFFEEVVTELDNGAVAALHHQLLQRDLNHFTVASRPPMTEAKQELIDQSTSSEERFLREWVSGEIDGPSGEPLPCCPCVGSDLYAAYRKWCERYGERPRRAQDLIGCANKQHGWRAGRTANCWRSFHDRSITKRKLVIPSTDSIETAISANPHLERLRRERFESDTEWHTHGCADFYAAISQELAQ